MRGRQEADGPLPPAEAPATSFPWFMASILLPRRRLCGMKPFEIRAPRSEDLRALAHLKIEWARIDPRPDGAAEWAYADALSSWMDRMGDRVICRIAVLGGGLVGMGWLVVSERVPDFGDRKRRTGDVQSMYVVPAKRGHGIGRALLDALCAAADERGLPRVTVRSSPRAVPLYESAGFATGPTLLDRDRPS
jgi:GNAT superfamily N-acetyltransferase